MYSSTPASIRTADRVVAEFERSRTSLEDNTREVRLKSAPTPEIVEKIQDMVLVDCPLIEKTVCTMCAGSIC